MKAAMSDRLREILNDPENRERLREALNNFHSDPLQAILTLKDGTIYIIRRARTCS